jgi:hypothetical protein
MLILIGAQLVVAGLTGEMLMRVYHEGQGRPQYHVRVPAGAQTTCAASAQRPGAEAGEAG